MRQIILFIGVVSMLALTGCSSENSSASLGAHPANWLDAHPGNIAYSTNSFVQECGICHSFDLQGTAAAPSCFSTSFNGNSCHPSGPVPHVVDGSFLAGNNHGPVAKADLTVCQSCHSDNPNGGAGSNPRFNVGIDSAGGNGCESCHPVNYAHPDAWPRPYLSPQPLNDKFHYSAGNIQQACTLCHGAALNGGIGSSCLDCHAETTGFTLDCTACHAAPPTAGGATDHSTITATGPTVADVPAHNVCTTCHGMSESGSSPGTFSNSSNYLLFNKTTDTLGDHRNDNINMNSDTSYNETTGGCDNAGCHGGGGDYTLPDSGLTVQLGAYGSGAPHTVGQDWLLPTGHVAAVDNTCISCHSLSGGGQSPACEDCHINNGGSNPVLTGCVSCHSAPPATASTAPSARPDREGAHITADPNYPDLANTHGRSNCSDCHNGGGTGQLTHYDRVDQTTPDYPADVNLVSGLNSLAGTAAYNSGAGTCSQVNCHGGQTTPNWLSGTINVNQDCQNCHRDASVSNDYTSYTNPDQNSHDFHIVDRGYFCTVCHNTTKLAVNHFTNLQNPGQWLNSAGSTIAGGTTNISEANWNDTTNSCNPSCHGSETW